MRKWCDSHHLFSRNESPWIQARQCVGHGASEGSFPEESWPWEGPGPVVVLGVVFFPALLLSWFLRAKGRGKP